MLGIPARASPRGAVIAASPLESARACRGSLRRTPRLVGAGRGGTRLVRPPHPVPDDSAVGRRGRLRVRRALVGERRGPVRRRLGRPAAGPAVALPLGLALPGSERFDIRLMAALWSCAIAVVLGLLVTRVAGRRAGAAAALLSGLLSTAPVIEGFTANGELMAHAAGTRGARADRALAAARRAGRDVRRRPLRRGRASSSSSRATTAGSPPGSGSCSRPGAAGGRPARRCARSARSRSASR